MRVLTGIVGQGIQHEESKCLVGLNYCIGRTDLQGKSLQFEGLTAAGHHAEELVECKILDRKTQRTLPHLYPTGQNIIIIVYLVYQFFDVGIFVSAHVIGLGIVFRTQFFYFIANAVNIGQHALHNGKTSLTHYILTLVGSQVLVVDVLFFLQTAAFIAKLQHRQTVFECPYHKRHDHAHQRFKLFLPVVAPIQA